MSPLDDETLLPQEDEQEMFEHFRLVADKGQAPLRVDKFITTHQEDTSRNRVQQAIKLGYVLVNDKVVKANYICQGQYHHPPLRRHQVRDAVPAARRGDPAGEHPAEHRLRG